MKHTENEPVVIKETVLSVRLTCMARDVTSIPLKISARKIKTL